MMRLDRQTGASKQQGDTVKRSLLSILIGLCLPAMAQTVPVVVPTTSTCATSVDGTVVGILNPLTVPVVAPGYSGTLPAGTYYIEIVWTDAASHTTLASPEVSAQLSLTGNIQVSPPVTGTPSTAAAMAVYIATTSGAETLQGSAAPGATYTQSTPLTTGTALPTTNTTLCAQIANDAGWPTGTGYKVSLSDSSGNSLPGYPMQWQLLGPGATYNLNTGLPLYNGAVTYGSTIQAIPYNHGPQSISGPLSMTGYPLTQVLKLGVGTGFPAWPIDNELGATNSLGGYIVNGGVGVTTGSFLCAGSDVYHTFLPSATACTPAGSINYQTLMLAGAAMPVEPAINFTQSPLFSMTDHPTSPAATDVALNVTGTDGAVVTANSAAPQGYTAVWDAFGGLTGVPSSAATRVCNTYGCYREESDGTLEEWGSNIPACVYGSGACTETVTFPHAFTTPTNLSVTTGCSNFGNCLTSLYTPVTTPGFVMAVGPMTYVGGSGNNFNGNETVQWYAVGY